MCVFVTNFRNIAIKNGITIYKNVWEINVILIVLSLNFYSVRKLILHSGKHTILISRVNGNYVYIKNIVLFAVKA